MSKATRELSEEYLRASMAFQPEGMLEVLADANAMAVEAGQFAQAMAVRYARASEYPLHPAVKELYSQVANTQRAVAAAAAGIAPTIEKLHKEELERLRNPRPGEQMWDVRANKDAA